MDKHLLPKYLSRIGLDWKAHEGLPPTLDTLAKVQLAHLQSIPFENIDVVLRRRIDMTFGAVFDKLVNRSRGGYCFEQNTLLMEALRCLGFAVTPVLARVRWNRPKEVHTPFTHLVLLVVPPTQTAATSAVGETTPETYLVDVGFGGLQCLSPLRINTEDPQLATEGGTYRLAADGAELTVEWELRGEWQAMYKFPNPRGQDLARVEALACDQAVANFWSFAWPEARWTGCLFAARIVGVERVHVLNSEKCVRRADGTAERTAFGSSAEVLACLRGEFGLALDPDAELDLALVDAQVSKGAPATFHVASYLASS
jgi:N-hydroxyarylamine O-acetyltransferase